MTINAKEKSALVAAAIGLGVIMMSVSGYFFLNAGGDEPGSSQITSFPDSANGSTGETSDEPDISGSADFSGISANSSGGSGDSGLTSPDNSSGGSSSSSGSQTAVRFVWPKPAGKVVSKIKVVNGIPRLYINTKQVPPLMFFGNTDMNARYDTLISEFSKAAKGNIHLHSIISSPEIGGSNPPEIQYFDLMNDLDTMIAGDPEGYALLRINVGKYYNTGNYPADEIVRYVQTRAEYNPMVSIASDTWFEQAKTMLKETVEFIRSDPLYSKHVMGYHLDCGEWFQYMFRENGLDISPANTRKFREWLKIKYSTNAALRTAWGNPLITLDIAAVPQDLPGNLSGKPETLTLMLKTTDQRYIDYLDYIGDLVSSRIDGLAAAIKDASNDENIVIAFYGYLFELADPQSGHYSLEKLLKSKNIDGFSSPECYLDRNVGELFPKQPAGSTGAYMTAVDSVQRAGKLWFVESDQRTYINRYGAATENDTYLVPAESVGEIVEIAKRDVGANMIRGAAIWFMDLWAVGWLDEQEIWDNNGKLADLYQAYAMTQKSTPKLDVAFVVDEKAMSLVSQPTDSAWHFLSYQRYDFYRAGISWGMYTMQDLLDNRIKDSKVIFVLTPFRLSAANVVKIKAAAAGKTIVFSYGFGSTSASDILSLTGMTITQLNDRTNVQLTPAAGASALDLQAKSTMGASVSANPRWVVSSGSDSAIGQYADGKTGFAVKDNGAYKAVFFGGMRMDVDVIRAIIRYAGGVNVFTESDDVVMANENMLIIHSSKTGVKTIRFPVKCDVYDYFEGTWYTGVTSIKTSIALGQTKYYFFGKKTEIEAMKLPIW